MRTTLLLPVAVLLGALTAAPARADDIDIHRNDAVQIVFEQDLRADVNRPGDRFVVRVDKDPLLRKGTLMFGRVLGVHWANRRRAASMDLELTSLVTPDGTRRHIEALPGPINDPHLTRGADGRLIARYKPGDDKAYVFGGTVGGLILGGIGHRPIRGAFIGALIGALAGHADRRANANLVVAKGEKMVAVFERDVTDAPWRADDRPGWRHNEGSGASETLPHASAEIRYGDSRLEFDGAQPFEDDGVLMVPLEKTAQQLDLDVTEHTNGVATIDGPDSSMEVYTDSNEYKLNDSSGRLAHKVVQRDDTLYVPINVFAPLKADSILVNGKPVDWRS
ncbi:MAG TPA: stalk domain-containing protein [Fimbriimonas sp.]|nr:stalk domain-containing protein [Fimbriimonas sp.]